MATCSICSSAAAAQGMLSWEKPLSNLLPPASGLLTTTWLLLMSSPLGAHGSIYQGWAPEAVTWMNLLAACARSQTYSSLGLWGLQSICSSAVGPGGEA